MANFKRVLLLLFSLGCLSFDRYLVAQGSSNVLAQKAAALNAGQWVLLNTEGDGSGYGREFTNSGLGVGGMFTYASKAAYDPTRQRIFYMASGHEGRSNPAQYVDENLKFITYEITTNKWTRLSNPQWAKDGLYTSNSHGYQLQTVAGGRYFRSVANLYSIYSCDINKENVADIGGSNCPGNYESVVVPPPPSATITRGVLEYFPDRKSLLFIDSAGGEVHTRSMTSSSWTKTLSLFPDLTGDGIAAAYNPVHKVIVFGGGASAVDLNYKWWKYTANGAITLIDKAPVGSYAANNTLFSVDPNSGNFIMIRPNDFASPTGYWFYQLDITKPAGSQWTRRTDLEAAIPQLIPGSYTLITTLITPLPEYGVNMVMTGDKVYLYKHAPGAGVAPSSDTTPPVISSVSPSSTTSSSVNIGWATDEIADGQVEYGTSTAYGSSSTLQTALVLSHSITLTGLNAGTAYHYRVKSRDWAGNLTVSTNFTFSTSATSSQPPSTPPVTTPPPPGSLVGGYAMPSLEDEKNTYRRWGWTWRSSQEPSRLADPMTNYLVEYPDIHGDTEGDDLWTYLMMYLRTGNNLYLKRAQGWARFFKDDFLQCRGGGQNYCYDRNGFGGDHFYGFGLVAWYEFTKDPAYLTAAENLAADLEIMYGPDTTYGCLPTNACIHYQIRGVGRQLNFISRLTEVSGSSRWIALRDKIIGLVLNSPNWDSTYGMYFGGDIGLTDQLLGQQGAYAAGGRVQASNQIGVLAEGMFRAYRATGNTQLRDRLVAMARYVDRYGMDPTHQYTASLIGVTPSGQPWHVYALQNPVTFWPSAYTTSLVNVLVMGYKYTGDVNLLNRAKHFFNRGTKGVATSPTLRSAKDNIVGHFVDTEFETSSRGFYLDWNKGELQYTYLLFENGGSPVVEASTRNTPGPEIKSSQPRTPPR